MDEAHLERVGAGLAPVGEGWFVVNARDAAWTRHPTFGLRCPFELNGPIARDAGIEPRVFPQLGIGLCVLRPGQPSTLYHEELDNQEDFLVLEGECVAVIEGETRALRQWDFVHCPPGTRHSFVGAGDGCCVLLAVGSRGSRRLRYHPTPHAESVSAPTENAADAYAPYGHWAGDAASPL